MSAEEPALARGETTGGGEGTLGGPTSRDKAGALGSFEFFCKHLVPDKPSPAYQAPHTMLRAAVFVHSPNSLKFHKRIQPSFYILFLFHSETFEGPQGTYQEVGPGQAVFSLMKTGNHPGDHPEGNTENSHDASLP